MTTPQRAALAALGMLCAWNLHAEEIPIARQADAPCSATLDEAARAALALAMPLSKQVEHGGVVLELNGRFCFTTPEGGTETEVLYRVVMPEGVNIAAIYHTHPSSSAMY